MNYLGILDELRNERELVDRAIAVLERIQAGAPRGRGRPPRWLSDRKSELTQVGGGAAPVSGDTEGAPKRKRGRPRKHPLPV